jgi:uncharacterized phosphosugar-binding protein
VTHTERTLRAQYRDSIVALFDRIDEEESESIAEAGRLLAAQLRDNRIVTIYGPGGHSNIAAQEIFFRSGALTNVSAILDGGTLLSNGAVRATAMERMPGYGRIVIENAALEPGTVLILVNAYGINAALIDAALTASAMGVTTIGVTSREAAENTPPEHPARHPSRRNLADIVDVVIDTKVPLGDAVVNVPGVPAKVAAISTFANAFALNCLSLSAMHHLVDDGITPSVWLSSNAPGGDQANAQFIGDLRRRIAWL